MVRHFEEKTFEKLREQTVAREWSWKRKKNAKRPPYTIGVAFLV